MLSEAEIELQRLQRAIGNISNLASNASQASALAVCQRITAICNQALKPACEKDCSRRHSVAELARIENVSDKAIYKWQEFGLQINNGYVIHSDWANRRLLRESLVETVE